MYLYKACIVKFRSFSYRNYHKFIGAKLDANNYYICIVTVGGQSTLTAPASGVRITCVSHACIYVVATNNMKFTTCITHNSKGR